jgi:hypothetical protein
MDAIDSALAPTADPTQVPTGLTGKLGQWISWITNRIKAILGTANWYDIPPASLQAAANHISAASPHSGHALASDLTTHLAESVYLQEEEPIETNSKTLWFAINSEVDFSEGGVAIYNAETSDAPPETTYWFQPI